MANIREIKVDTFMQIITDGKPNRKVRIVGKTEKRVYIWIMEKNKYILDEKGNRKRHLVHPKNLKFYK